MKRNSEDGPYKEIGQNLKKLRSFMGLSQSEMGEILGVTFQQIQKYETGKNRLPALQLYILHQTFKVPFELFFENVRLEGDPPAQPPQALLLRRIQSIRDNKTALRALQILDLAL